ncbi:mediator of RNA polymerase II transcription subunit 16-like [Oscarella lobularis]|uniref:mediator of RNA polymerase II transcription subunit 16-like n=1 Tax=Oscarella lobularis TaxID=121494 RepID=UPI003313DEF7
MTPAFRTKWSIDCSRLIECVLPEESASIAWSTTNAIAFASSESPSSSLKRGSHLVHIVYPERPWERTTFDAGGLVYRLLWNYDGTKLLGVDTRGKCSIWQADENFANVWKSIWTLSDCERFVGLSWLQRGPQHTFQVLGEVSLSWSKVFPIAKSRPVLRGVWGQSTDGFIGLSASGKLHVALLASDRLVASEQLPHWKEKEMCAGDLLVTPDGLISVAVADQDCIISVYQVTLDVVGKDKCTMKIEKCSQFNVTDTSSIHLPSKINKLCLQWHSALSVIINVSGVMTDNNVEIWESSSSSMSDFNWIKQASYRIDDGSVAELALAGIPSVAGSTSDDVAYAMGSEAAMGIRRPGLTLPLRSDSSSSSGGGMRGAVIVSLCTGKLLCLDRKNLSLIASVHVSRRDEANLSTDGHYLIPASKRARKAVSHRAVALATSPCSCCVATVTDAGEFLVFRLSPRALGLKQDVLSPVHMAKQFTSLLLYGLVSGRDWWDVLVSFCATPKMEGLFEEIWRQLECSFTAQSQSQQELHCLQYLSMLYMLGRCSADGFDAASLAHSQLTLNALGSYIKALLVGPLDNVGGKWPEEQLTGLKNDKRDDLEEVRKGINLHESMLPSPEALLCCRHLVQWTVDTASSLIQKNGLALSKAPFYVRTASLGLLRELLVIVQIWVELQPRCSPRFTRVPSSMDCLSVLFKQVTKLWNERQRESSHQDPVAGDIDSTVPLVPAPPDLDSSIHLMLAKGFTVGRYGNMSQPVEYEFDCSPGHFQHPMALKSHDPFLSSGLKTPKGFEPPRNTAMIVRDIVDLLFIASDESGLMRKCSRCSGLSMVRESGTNQELSLFDVWGSYWTHSCMCGGQWIRQQEN